MEKLLYMLSGIIFRMLLVIIFMDSPLQRKCWRQAKWMGGREEEKAIKKKEGKKRKIFNVVNFEEVSHHYILGLQIII